MFGQWKCRESCSTLNQSFVIVQATKQFDEIIHCYIIELNNKSLP